MLLKVQQDPVIPFLVAIIANIGYWLYCLYDIHIQIRLDIRRYLKEVAMPGFFLSLILWSVGSVQSWMIPEDTFSHFLLAFVSMLIIGICVVYCLLSVGERTILQKYIQGLYGKLKK